MKRTFPELPGWFFEMNERSAGVYEVAGSDGFGHRVQTSGTDCDALLAECRQVAARLTAEMGNR